MNQTPVEALGPEPFSFTPAPNFSGTASFTYSVTDTGDGASPPLTSSHAATNARPAAEGR